MVLWTVVMTEDAEHELKQMLIRGELEKEDIHILKIWLREMEEFGPKYIANSSEWHDHPLQREWWGFRASAFGARGRVIYKVKGSRITVEVHRVTANHNYKR